MEFIKDIKIILKPFIVGISCLISLSLLVVALYSYVQYQQYRNNYQKAQQEEFITIQQKTKAFSEKIKELLALTSTRIKESKGENKRIQNILSSTPRLYPLQELPKIKNLSYQKLSYPQRLITRLGIFSLDNKHLPPTISSEKESILTFYADNIVGKALIFSESGNVEGVLEVQISFVDLKSFIGEPNYLERGQKILKT